MEFFSNWGIELLVTQLHDKNKAISSEALEILDEACEDKVRLFLRSLVEEEISLIFYINPVYILMTILLLYHINSVLLSSYF